METSNRTKDHETIRSWASERNGKPTLVETNGSSSNENEGILRIKFDDKEEDLKEISWNDFFRIFDKEKLTFLYDTDKENRFNKFIRQ